MNPTLRVELGSTAVRPTQLGLGTAPLAGLFEPVDEHDAEEVIERAWELGIRFFDTAPLYGYGLAEQRLGRVLSQKPRSEYVVATKVGRLLRPRAGPDLTNHDLGQPLFKGTPPVQPIFDFSSAGVVRSHEESLQRLGLDRVDILHIHDPDDYETQAVGESLPALEALKRRGVVNAVGAGMNQWEMLSRFASTEAFDCFLLAGRYTLLDQSGEPLLNLCRALDIGIIAAGVYNSGVLADPRPGTHYNYQPAAPAVVSRAQQIARVCANHDVPLKAAAIQFPACHPSVTCVLTGARSVDELDENVALFRLELPDQLWSELRHEGLLEASSSGELGR